MRELSQFRAGIDKDKAKDRLIETAHNTNSLHCKIFSTAKVGVCLSVAYVSFGVEFVYIKFCSKINFSDLA